MQQYESVHDGIFVVIWNETRRVASCVDLGHEHYEIAMEKISRDIRAESIMTVYFAQCYLEVNDTVASS